MTDASSTPSSFFQIWIDGDACPVVVREILCRAAEKNQIQLTLVANQPVQLPRSPFIKQIQVSAGFDEADHLIAERVGAGDLVITSDIPLAADVIEREGLVLNPRGEQYDANNIRQRLQMRDFMESMRSSGVQTGGPPPYSQTDKQQFANALDRILQRARQAGRIPAKS